MTDIKYPFIYRHKDETVWAEETGIPAKVIRWRICHGWPTGKTLTKPVRKLNKK